MVEAIAFHGWAFNSTVWRAWERLFAGAGVVLKAFDRGYYGNPCAPLLSDNTTGRIVIAHSYGLHLCPPEIRRTADALIVFGGFSSFHPDREPARRRSAHLYDAMCAQFAHAPVKVLDAFFARCGCPESARRDITGEMDTDLLHRDLLDLGRSFIDLKGNPGNPAVLVLHGSEDRIVPVEKGRELASQIGTRVSYCELTTAGHALPFTHSDECWHHIEPFVRRFTD